MRPHEFLSSTGSADAPGSADEDDAHLGQGAGRRRVLRQGKCTPTTMVAAAPTIVHGCAFICSPLDTAAHAGEGQGHVTSTGSEFIIAKSIFMLIFSGMVSVLINLLRVWARSL